MQLLTLLPLALIGAAFAQEEANSTSVSYSNAATTLLTQTDANGVITGQPSQPAAFTSQPSVFTSQQPAALVPAGFTAGTTTATYGNQTFTIAVVSGVTRLVTSTPTPTTQSAGAGASGASASGSSASASSSSSAGAGTHIKVGAGALAAAGGFFAVFM